MIPAQPQYQGLDITFQVTEACNLSCKYCYEVSKKPTELPLEYAQKFIDLILTDPDPIGCGGTSFEWLLQKGLILDFIGGEPFMVPGLLDKIVQYFQYKAFEVRSKWQHQWRLSFSSNGTLFHEPEVKKFLLKYRGNISLGVSVDGVPEIHNANRSDSLDQILKNWDWYLWYAGSAANTKSTLNRESIPYIYRSIKYLHEDLKLQFINMNFIFENMGLTAKDLVLLDQELAKVVDYILEHCDDLHVNMLDEGFGIGHEILPDQLDKGWCGAGAMPCLTVNGKIYPCFRFTPSTMHKPDYDLSVGDIWTGLSRKENFGLIRKQTRKEISPEKCFSCPTESSCAWCIGGAYAESGKFYRQTNICEVHKILDKWARVYWNKYYKLKGEDKSYAPVAYAVA